MSKCPLSKPLHYLAAFFVVVKRATGVHVLFPKRPTELLLIDFVN